LCGIVYDPTPQEKNKTIVEKEDDMILIKNIEAPKKINGKDSYLAKLKNYGLWISILSFVFLILINLFEIKTKIHFLDFLLNVLILIFTIFGITNNPNTKNKWWKDDLF
jgi:uncharacterized membrane protein